jgi:hypothetical protein
MLILFVVEGVETNPGRTGEQNKIVQILSYIKNKEKGSKTVQKPLQSRN